MADKTSISFVGRLRDPEDSLIWREFFDRYWRPLFAFATKRGCSEESAEDVVQETLLAVFDARSTFVYDPSRGRFRNWLCTIVCQKIALVSRRRTPPAASDIIESASSSSESPDPDAAAEFERLFDLGVLAAALEVIRQKVEPATYQAFELTQLHEMSADEAASATGLSRNAVYQARKRVMQNLEELLAEYHASGKLDVRLKAVLELTPPPRVVYVLSSRVETTFTSRQ